MRNNKMSLNADIIFAKKAEKDLINMPAIVQNTYMVTRNLTELQMILSSQYLTFQITKAFRGIDRLCITFGIFT